MTLLKKPEITNLLCNKLKRMTESVLLIITGSGLIAIDLFFGKRMLQNSHGTLTDTDWKAFVMQKFLYEKFRIGHNSSQRREKRKYKN
jgi:hypothetical protein